MGVPHHHRDRFPSPELLHCVDVRARLHKSSGKGMAQIMKPKAFHVCFLPSRSCRVEMVFHSLFRCEPVFRLSISRPLSRYSTAPNPHSPSNTYMRLTVSTVWLL
jgi:hypothetical protein